MRTEFISLEEARDFLTQGDKGDSSNRVDLQADQRLLQIGLRNALTPRQLECVQLYYFKGYTMEQTGEELGIGKATVCRHLQKAKTRLNRFFQLAREIQEKQHKIF